MNPAGCIRKRALQNLPDSGSETFSGLRGSLQDYANSVRARYIPLQEKDIDPVRTILFPFEVKIDRTKCLIRALRTRPDTGEIISAAVPGSLNPKLVPIREQQNRMQRQQQISSRNEIISHKRQGISYTKTNGEQMHSHAPSSSSCSPANESSAKDVRKPKRQKIQSYSSMSVEQRRACVRISLTAAMLRSPSKALRTLQHNWEKNPRCPQRITYEVRQELALSSIDWSIEELKCYLREADLGVHGSRKDLARRVYSHLRPPSDINAHHPRNVFAAGHKDGQVQDYSIKALLSGPASPARRTSHSRTSNSTWLLRSEFAFVRNSWMVSRWNNAENVLCDFCWFVYPAMTISTDELSRVRTQCFN